MQDQDAYLKAKKRVEAKFGFYIHLGVYSAVNFLLLVLNLQYSPHYFWFLWSVFGWGIGLTAHALSLYVFGADSPVKQRIIQRELQELTSRHATGDR